MKALRCRTMCLTKANDNHEVRRSGRRLQRCAHYLHRFGPTNYIWHIVRQELGQVRQHLARCATQEATVGHLIISDTSLRLLYAAFADPHIRRQRPLHLLQFKHRPPNLLPTDWPTAPTTLHWPTVSPDLPPTSPQASRTRPSSIRRRLVKTSPCPPA